MKFIALALAAVALVAAQSTPDISNLPTCVLGCYATDTGSSCSQTDFACLCNDQTFLQAVNTCLAAGCNEADAQAGQAFGIQTCQSAGVSLSATDSAPATSSTPASSSSSSAATSSVSSSSGTSSVPSSSSSSPAASQTAQSSGSERIVASAFALFGSLFALAL